MEIITDYRLTSFFAKAKIFVVFLFFFLMVTPMLSACSIFEEERELSEAQHKLMKALSAESGSLRSVRPVQEMCLSLIDEMGNWQGGIAGYTLYGSLVIDMLWVHPDYRNQGYGRALVNNFENWGISQGVTFAKLSTMEWWNAVPFYNRLGYEVVYEEGGYEGGAKQFTLKKRFDKAASG